MAPTRHLCDEGSDFRMCVGANGAAGIRKVARQTVIELH